MGGFGDVVSGGGGGLSRILVILISILVGQAFTSTCCSTKEKMALLQLKASLISSSASASEELRSWSDANNSCCLWERVRCDQLPIQHVTALSLDFLGIRDLNGTLFQAFEKLTSLDLSDNYYFRTFRGISEALANLTQLRELDLSYNYFSGSIQGQGICKLKHLQNLNLGWNALSGSLPRCLGYLTSLQSLRLSSNNLSGDVISIISNLTSLKNLSLSHNQFQGEFRLDSLLNHSKMEYLGLSNSGLQVKPVDPHSLSTLQLKGLGLSDCSLYMQSSIFQQFISHQHELRSLDISHNGLTGPFPTWILHNNSRIKFLLLRNNSFGGTLDLDAQATIQSLTFLDISMNRFYGHFPGNIGSVMPRLLYLKASTNTFDGEIPASIGNMTELRVLDLSNNNFSGEVTSTIFTGCASLRLLKLSNNSLQGDIIPEYMNITHVRWLHLDNNHFSGTIPNALLKIKHDLEILDLSNNKVVGGIPRWMGNFSGLALLSLSNNQLQGHIPGELCNLKQLIILLLGHNRLNSEIPVQLCQLQGINMMDLSSNNISGVIPSCFGKMSFGKRSQYLHEYGLSSETNKTERVTFLTKSKYDTYQGYNLAHMSGLILSCNQLTGEIPQELGLMGNIHALNLSHNRLFGSIPKSFSMLRSIESLDLSYNRLSGEMPSQLVEVTTLETFNVSYNNLSGQVLEKGQFATFDERSYTGNPFLCGSYLEHRCTPFSKDDTEEESDDVVIGFDWEVFFWSFGMSSSIVMLASMVVLWINPYWRRAWFQFIEFHVFRCLISCSS